MAETQAKYKETSEDRFANTAGWCPPGFVPTRQNVARPPAGRLWLGTAFLTHHELEVAPSETWLCPPQASLASTTRRRSRDSTR